MKPSSRRSGESSSARSGGTIVTWLHMQEKLATPSALAPHHRQRRRGRGRLEPDREEDDLAVGVRLGDPQRVERRVDHPHVGALGLRLEQRLLGAGHPHHVAEAGEDHLLVPGDRDPVVDPAHRDHADRAARARGPARRSRAAGRRPRSGRSSGCARRRPPSACSGGRGRPRRGSRRPGPCRARRRGTPRRISWPPHAALAIAVPAWTSRRSPGATGSTSAVSTVLVAGLAVGAERQAALGVDAQHLHRDRLVPAGDATGGGRSAERGPSMSAPGPHSIALAFSSSSSCS